MKGMKAIGNAAVRQFLEDDNFARHSGIELVSIEPGHAIARMTVKPTHLNGYRIVQGGAIFTLADLAFAAASNSHGTIAVAINVSITFIKATKNGLLQAEAREVACNPKLGTYIVEVRDDQGDLVAQFQGLVYRKSERIEDWYKQSHSHHESGGEPSRY
ncbi:MAG: PaaI family thioesterase [Verrucomicrobiae bacterium]|nr:PaaI family thioesterase [Verrucomicrobiae bacterium]